MKIDWQKLRADFPILDQQVHGKPLVYFDNAATSQKPRAVIDALVHYYERDNANVHRGIHELSNRATNHFEEARRKLQRFINAGEEREVIFTSNCTDGINLVAHGYGRKFIGTGDEIIITTSSTTRTSCRGRSFASSRARGSASSRSPAPAYWISTPTRHC